MGSVGKTDNLLGENLYFTESQYSLQEKLHRAFWNELGSSPIAINFTL